MGEYWLGHAIAKNLDALLVDKDEVGGKERSNLFSPNVKTER